MELQVAFAGVASAVIAFAPQTTLAQEQRRSTAEAQYLTGIDKQMSQSKSYGVRGIDATTSTRNKIGRGYQVCRDLKLGRSVRDLNNAAAETAMRHHDGTMAADQLMYFFMIQKSAIRNLCPEYKQLLDT
jgi:hypothetical protein